MLKEKGLDIIWKAVAVGVGIFIQAPVEVAKVRASVVFVNGKRRMDLPFAVDTGALVTAKTDKSVRVDLVTETRRTLVFG